MRLTTFGKRISASISAEMELSREKELQGELKASFRHLERAHVLGQASTLQHVRVHVGMLRWALRHRQSAEACGQVLRIVGAATKTALGWVPHGNTGGANVSPFKPLPIPPDLAKVIHDARQD